jgi:hypothetical protein
VPWPWLGFCLRISPLSWLVRASAVQGTDLCWPACIAVIMMRAPNPRHKNKCSTNAPSKTAAIVTAAPINSRRSWAGNSSRIFQYLKIAAGAPWQEAHQRPLVVPVLVATRTDD